MTTGTPKRGDEQRDKDGRVWIVASVHHVVGVPTPSRVLKGSLAHRMEFPESAAQSSGGGWRDNPAFSIDRWKSPAA